MNNIQINRIYTNIIKQNNPSIDYLTRVFDQLRKKNNNKDIYKYYSI